MTEYQTRSETNGLKFHESLEHAFEAAENDKTIWKISFNLPSGKRKRFLRDKGVGFQKQSWIDEPIR